MDLHDLLYRHGLDRRPARLYADPDADEDDWLTILRDAKAARALLGAVSTLTGHASFAQVARSALAT